MTPRFFILFSWLMVRYLQRHRLLAMLNVLSIGLGIAVFVAIQIANRSANSSFAAGVDLVAGRAHLEIRGRVDENLWPTFRSDPEIEATTGLVEGVVALTDFPGEYLRILGVDLFSQQAFATFRIGPSNQKLDFERWLAVPGGIALSEEMARHFGLNQGDSFSVSVNGRRQSLVVLGVLDPLDSAAAGQVRFAAMDIGWAQELLGTQGWLSSLQLRLKDPEKAPEFAQRLQARLPADLQVNPPRQRSFQMEKMLSAFQLNLSALSMVSLLVGTFLIYSTVSASVTRRRTEIGVLRSLGATRSEIRWWFLGEAMLFGLLGLLLGAGAGVALASTLIGAVAQTISSLYVLVSIEDLRLSPWVFVLAAGFGMGAVLVGAWVPAGEAAQTQPLAALSLGTRTEQAQSSARRWHWWSLVLLVAVIPSAWGALHGGPPWLSFVAAFAVLAAFALLAPGSTILFGRGMAWATAGQILGRIAAENLRRYVHRNGVTAGSLGVAVAMTTGLTVMIHSFRQSVNAWVDRGIVADLFVAPASNGISGVTSWMDPVATEWFQRQPEVLAVDTYRELPIVIGQAPALLTVLEGAYRQNMTFLGGAEAAKMAQVFAGQSVAVSESFARKFQVTEGGSVELATPRGKTKLVVGGIYRDYTRDQGVILIGRRLYSQFWQDPQVQSVAVYLHHGADSAKLTQRFQTEFSDAGQYLIYSNRALRTRILNIFDQTFTVTYVLRSIAILVALVGIFLSVSTLVTERAREIGLLRAIGASPLQIQALFMAEAGMIGSLASVLGSLGGILLAMVLTWVVNPAFFGWTISLQIPWRSLLLSPLWIVPASVGAAWFPAWRASRGVIAQTVREE